MNSLSVKRKRTLSLHWEFAVVTLFVGQPKREKLSFRSYPSLFRGELKIEIELSFWERRYPNHTYPFPHSLLQRKKFAYMFSFWALSKAAFDRCYLEKWLEREKEYINQELPVWVGQSRTLHFWREDDPGEIVAPFQLLKTSLDVFRKKLAL